MSGPDQAASSAGVRFLGRQSEFFRLLARGALFLMVTLGIYRFWLNTDVRRYLWSNTEIAGETLEYTGTPLELLIGFLIAIAILVPLYALLFLATLSLGTIGRFSGVIGFALLTVLSQYAIYRARRYRLTRTIYRSIRFHQDGSAWRYAICAIFWWTLTILTLGLAYPWKEARLERFKMRHTYYGNVQGAFAGSGWRLFLRGLPMWIVVVLPLVAALFILPATANLAALKQAATLSSGEEAMSHIEGANPQLYGAIVFAILAGAWSTLMGAVLYPAFQAMVIRWWASGLRFGELTVTSKLRTAAIYGAYMRCLGWSLLFLVVLLVAGTAVVLVFAFTFGQALRMVLPQSLDILGGAAGLGFYVVAMLGLSAIYQATVKFAIWRFGAESLELTGTALLEQVRAEGGPGSAVGEGLADALNVGSF